MNNPMNYTDPSGYAWIDSNWRAVASIAISFFVPGALMANFGANAVWAKVITGMISSAVQTGSLKGALTGGLGAAMFHGIGSHFKDAAAGPIGKDTLAGGGTRSLSGGQFAAKGTAHAAAGGVMSVLNGGKFGHGFVSAGFVEAVNPALAGMSKPAQAAASIVVGGTSSILAGGKFANGAVTASFQLAFNHWYSINNGAVKNVLPQKDRTAISLELSGSICGPAGGFSGGTGIGLSIPDKFWKISEYQVFGSVQASLGIGSIFYLGIGLSHLLNEMPGQFLAKLVKRG